MTGTHTILGVPLIIWGIIFSPPHFLPLLEMNISPGQMLWTHSNLYSPEPNGYYKSACRMDGGLPFSVFFLLFLLLLLLLRSISLLYRENTIIFFLGLRILWLEINLSKWLVENPLSKAEMPQYSPPPHTHTYFSYA